MNRAFSIVGLLSLTACHSPSRSASQPPDPRAPVKTEVVSVRADSTLDSSQAVALRGARERAYQAATQVDTIIVRPDTLRLHVGQVFQVFTGVTIDARTAGGTHVEHFAPMFEVGDNTIAGFTGPGLEGRRAGVTWLVISAFAGDEPNRRILTKSMIWIVVEP